MNSADVNLDAPGFAIGQSQDEVIDPGLMRRGLARLDQLGENRGSASRKRSGNGVPTRAARPAGEARRRVGVQDVQVGGIDEQEAIVDLPEDTGTDFTFLFGGHGCVGSWIVGKRLACPGPGKRDAYPTKTGCPMVLRPFAITVEPRHRLAIAAGRGEGKRFLGPDDGLREVPAAAWRPRGPAVHAIP
jgi:hypothetical protein